MHSSCARSSPLFARFTTLSRRSHGVCVRLLHFSSMPKHRSRITDVLGTPPSSGGATPLSHNFVPSDPSKLQRKSKPFQHNAAVICSATSPSGIFAATGGADGEIKVGVTHPRNRCLVSFFAALLMLIMMLFMMMVVLTVLLLGRLPWVGVQVFWIREFREDRVLLGHCAPVTALAFAKDEKLLVSGDQNGTVLVRLCLACVALRRFCVHAHLVTSWVPNVVVCVSDLVHA